MKKKDETNESEANDSFEAFEADDYFDDCPICQAMKKAEADGKDLRMEELLNAFNESKKQGALVGGSMFEDEGDKNNL